MNTERPSNFDPFRRSSAALANADRSMRRKLAAYTPIKLLEISEHVAQTLKTSPVRKAAEAAQYWRIPKRQVYSYLAIARWSPQAKAYVRAHASAFNSSTLILSFANRRWKSDAVLVSALKSYVEGGKLPKSKRGRAGAEAKGASEAKAATDPDVIAVADQVREHLRTRVTITGNGRRGELRISYMSVEQLEDLLTRMGIA